MTLNNTINVIYYLCPLAITMGLSIYMFDGNPQAENIATGIISFSALLIVFWWFVKDTKKYNYRRSLILNIMVLFLGFIALPYYFFRSRGVSGGFKATGIFILLFLGWYLLLFVGFYSARGMEILFNGT